jgi:hypothetical protein
MAQSGPREMYDLSPQAKADINQVAVTNRDFMMGWTPPDGIGVPKVEVLSTT